MSSDSDLAAVLGHERKARRERLAQVRSEQGPHGLVDHVRLRRVVGIACMLIMIALIVVILAGIWLELPAVFLSRAIGSAIVLLIGLPFLVMLNAAFAGKPWED